LTSDNVLKHFLHSPSKHDFPILGNPDQVIVDVVLAMKARLDLSNLDIQAMLCWIEVRIVV
jgi:hypothetical protein